MSADSSSAPSYAVSIITIVNLLDIVNNTLLTFYLEAVDAFSDVWSGS